MPTPLPSGYDIAIQWPSQRDDWHAVVSAGRVPLYGYPHGFCLARNTVWVAWRGELVGRFRVAEIRSARVKLLTGGRPAVTPELVVRLNTVKRLRPPRRISEISDPHALHRSRWPGGSFKYLTAGANQFVKLPDSRPSRRKAQPMVVEIDIQRTWLKATTVQRSKTDEHTAYGVEARLVVEYARWLEQRRGQPALRRQEITLGDGTRLLTDAWDEAVKLLIEAKATVDRPAIRMAMGQLIDYSQAMPKETRRAVLLPSKPTANILALLRSQAIEAIWQTASGDFKDSMGGALSR